MLVSQAAGLVAIAGVVALGGDPSPPVADLLPAAAAGLAGVVAISAFYRALAIGTMSIVAPVSATGAALPVIVGLSTGERPSGLQLAGMLAALVGVVLASREPDEGPERAAAARRSIALALVAALGIGTFFVGMDAAADADVAWAMLTARGVSVGALVAAAVVLRPAVRAPLPALPVLAVIGLLDASANGMFAYASTLGLLSLVAVLGSLYPVVTIALARAVLAERVQRVQAAGVALALAGVAAIAGG
jgi:drug/metabolite transporter (DMT)-like permease